MLIAVVAVVAVAMVAGGVYAGTVLIGGSGDVAATSTEPSSTGAADPSENEGNQAGNQEAEEPERDEVTPITTALTGAGYACYQSLTEPVDIGGNGPVMVHSCYLDPATDAMDDQVVTIQSRSDGTVSGVMVHVNYSPYVNGVEGEDRSGQAQQAFGDTLDRLEGPLLDSGDADTITEGQEVDTSPNSPALHSTQKLDWGTSNLVISEDRMRYTVELTADGQKLVAIPAGDTAVTITETKERYSGQGYSCDVDAELKVLTCRLERPGAIYTIQVFDNCLNHEERYDLICEGRAAFSVTNSVAFGNLSDAGFEELGTFLMESSDFAMGGWDSEARDWALESFGSTEPAVRHADFQGMHLSYEPGVLVPGGGPNTDYPNGVQISVQGYS